MSKSYELCVVHLVSLLFYHNYLVFATSFSHFPALFCCLYVLQVFAPAFRRNARWSVDPKVPDVGDESTTWSDVDAFYDFWYGFKSWREFPHPGKKE